MKPVRVDLFFDCISPYTHISLNVWARYASAWPVTLRLRPFFLGGVMQATGNQPPGMLAPRAHYMSQDLPRSAALNEVSLLDMPSNFFSKDVQKSAMRVARMMCAAQAVDGSDDAKVLQLAVAASDCLHAEPRFRSGSELTIDDALLEQACVRAGFEATTLLELAQGEAAKKALRANTEDAVARGAFGSPTAFVLAADGGAEAMFFGSDRMEQLAHHLSLPYGGARPSAKL